MTLSPEAFKKFIEKQIGLKKQHEKTLLENQAYLGAVREHQEEQLWLELFITLVLEAIRSVHTVVTKTSSDRLAPEVALKPVPAPAVSYEVGPIEPSTIAEELGAILTLILKAGSKVFEVLGNFFTNPNSLFSLALNKLEDTAAAVIPIAPRPTPGGHRKKRNEAVAMQLWQASLLEVAARKDALSEDSAQRVYEDWTGRIAQVVALAGLADAEALKAMKHGLRSSLQGPIDIQVVDAVRQIHGKYNSPLLSHSVFAFSPENTLPVLAKIQMERGVHAG